MQGRTSPARMRFVGHRTFSLEGSPRSLAAHKDGTCVCIGLRDGRIAVISAAPFNADGSADASSPRFIPCGPDDLDPVRALCHVRDDWWLVARTGGRLAWLQLTGTTHGWEPGQLTPRPPNTADLPTHISCLDDTSILVSYSRAGNDTTQHSSIVYKLEQAGQGPPLLRNVKTFRQSGRLRSAVRVRDVKGDPRWLLIGYTGKVWLLTRTKKGITEQRVHVRWGGDTPSVVSGDDWHPALVNDVAAIGSASGEPRDEMAVSTDVGAFLVRLNAPDPNDHSRILAVTERLDHAGLRGVPLAIASHTSTGGAGSEEGESFIWCYDSLGSVHLYLASHDGRPIWNRVLSQVRNAPTIQALAFRPSGGHAGNVVAWQSCRDDSVGVSLYELGTEEETAVTPHEPINKLRSLAQASEWLTTQYGDAGDPPSGVSPDLWRSASPETEPEAILADLFDPSPQFAHTLWEFLAHPSISLAREAIEIIATSDAPEVARRARLRESVDLWTQTLVGSILRYSPDFWEDLSLGVLRWLHRLNVWAAGLPPDTRANAGPVVARAAENALFDVRRWTLFAPRAKEVRWGDALRLDEKDGPRRLGIAARVARHREHPAPAGATFRQLEERLVEESLLFKHRVDDEAEELHAARGVAYDVARFSLEDGGELCAVVWRQQRIRLFLVSADGKLTTLQDIKLPAKRCRFGRAAVLWRQEQSGEYRLLTSLRYDDRREERLELYRVSRFPGGGEPVSLLPKAPGNPQHILHRDTLTCLRWVGDGYILAGFRRADGQADIELITVSERDHIDRRVIHLRETRGAALPNPVHSVHFDRKGDKLRVVAGCDDGTVHLVNVNLAGDEGNEPVPELVAQLAAPVWSIRCRVQNDTLRVYAGTADGHIAAWQQVPDAPERSNAFACLWSTREGGPIVALWTMNASLGEEDSGQPVQTPAVLAVARTGRAVLFSDHPDVIARSEDSLGKDSGSKLNRPRVPGQRLERFNLRSSAFAAALLLQPRTLPPPQPVARLFLVTGSSHVRVVGLHQPKRSGTRSEAYHNLGDLWVQCLKCPSSEEESTDVRLEPRRLRYPEALRALAPALWLLPIPFFLLDKWRQCAPLLAVPIYWYPRYLRSYVRCVHAYRHVIKALREAGNFDANAFEESRLILATQLEACLGQAHELGDKMLFEEISENLEKRFNNCILQVCAKQDKLQRERDDNLLKVYKTLLGGIEQACHPWLTTDVEAYGQVQATRIKNLVDGDVARELARHQGGRPSLLEIMRQRIIHVQRLLRDGNRLVPLETLRAVNFAVLRACWFTEDTDPRWPTLQALINGLQAFASQAASHADDALAHEIARAYALCVLLSPAEAIRIALSMRAARLPDDMIDETRAQVSLLWGLTDRRDGEKALLAPLTAERRRIGAALLEQHLSYPPGYQPKKEASGGRGAIEGRPPDSLPLSGPILEEVNAWTHAYGLCLDTLKALKNATRHLRETPEKTSFERISRLKERLFAANQDEKRLHFAQDRKFFLRQLGKLEEICERCGVPVSPGHGDGAAPGPPSVKQKEAENQPDDDRPVAPALVLAGPALRDWAGRALKELATEGIPEPRHRIYRDALQEFELVTSNLRSSSAVQRRLVTGVLGHHLMEALDEHVLALFETAHVLDPRRLGGATDNGAILHHSNGQTASGDFSLELTQQAERARSIPKNLRSLYQLLSPSFMGAQSASATTLFRQAFLAEETDEEHIHTPLSCDCTVEANAAAAISLIFSELASNHRVHGKPHGHVTFEIVETPVRKFLVTLPVKEREPEVLKHQLRRLVNVALGRMQRFIDRNEAVEESSGVGLYLANLAASTVGWTLAIARGDEVCTRRESWRGQEEAFYDNVVNVIAPNGVVKFEICEVNRDAT